MRFENDNEFGWNETNWSGGGGMSWVGEREDRESVSDHTLLILCFDKMNSFIMRLFFLLKIRICCRDMKYCS